MVVVGSNGYYANATITEYKSIAEERERRYEELLSKSHTEIESLNRMNETLKQHVKKRKVTSPDGTVVEEIDTDTDKNTVTETSVRQKIEIEYERKMATEKSKHQTEINKLTNRKLRIGIGYTSDRNYYGHGSYNIYGPISVGGGVVSNGTVLLDIGMTL